VFEREQAGLLGDRTGGVDLDRLIACVNACGFDESRYLADNPALQNAGFDAPAALFHFLAHGYAERRELTCGVLPDGLDEIRPLALPNRDYAVRLFCCLFFGQIKNPRTADRLWHGIDRGFVDCLRTMGGIPYFVIGDSHATHYLRMAWLDERWLAALPLVCHGGSAIDLANENSRSRFGPQLLQWARTVADLARPFDVPVFLKFGGIDTEFLWVRRRMRKGFYQFAVAEFDDLARESVFRYSRFLDALACIVDRGLLRICSVFPTVLGDADWAEVFLQVHRTSPERDRALAHELEKAEIPPLSTRTQLRGLYNDYLRDMCRAKSLAFVDDFSPFVDANGNTHRRCYATHGGRETHLDYDACEEPLVKIIRSFIN
jgi:hypothetical protein